MPTTHSLLAAAAVAATVAAASPATVLPAAQQPAFMQHMETFFPDVALGSAEYLRRAGVFADNAAFAVAIQAREQSGATHTALGSSPFASTPRDEFARQKRMPPRDIPAFALDAPRPVPPHVDVDVVGALPAAFDWTEHGAVTPVKDQGALGTCWAFSTAANIEGQDFLHGSMQLANYSVEQFVECDAVVNPSAGEADCGEFGGWPNVAYEYVIKAGGLRTWEDFPYCSGIPIGKPGNCVPCMAAGYNKTLCGDHHDLYCNASTTQGQDNVTGWCSNTERVAVTIDGWRTVSTNETEIAADLVATGPLSILLNAATLQFYHKGVADPALCNPSSLDHAVLLVGYGEDAGTPYWKVKNSWGTKWGEAGFFRMIRGTGKCGLNRWVTTAKMSE